MPGHLGGRQNITDIVLNCLPLQPEDFEQGAVIPGTKNGKRWSLFQLAPEALRFTMPQQYKHALIEAGNA